MKNIETIELQKGSHQTAGAGMCAMEAVAWLAGESHSDHPVCACPVIGAYVINMNDNLPADQRQRLKAYLPRIIGTKGTTALELKRAYVAADMAVRVFAVAALNSAGLTDEALKLQALDPIVDEISSRAASDASRAASDASYAASYASRAASDASRAASDASYASYAASYASRAASYADIYQNVFDGLDRLLACVED